MREHTLYLKDNYIDISDKSFSFFNVKIMLGILVLLPTISLVFYSDSGFGRITLILESLLLILIYHRTFNFIKKGDLLFLFANLFSLLITTNIYSASGSALIFLNTLISFKIFNNIVINKKTYIKIHLIMGISLSIYLFLIQKPKYFGNKIPDYFGNYINTNMISILFLSAFLHLFCALQMMTKNKKIKFLNIFITVIYGINVFFYGSRTALFCLFVFLLSIFFIKKSISYHTFKKITLLILIFSLLFPVIYVQLYNVYNQFEVFGKSFFSGRQYVWQETMDLIKQHFLFGCGNEYSVQMNSSNVRTESMHNTLLGLWKILGIIPTFSFMSFIVNHNDNKYNNKKNHVSQLAFLSTLPLCFFESFYTEAYLYMCFLPFLITNVAEEGEKNVP